MRKLFLIGSILLGACSDGGPHPNVVLITVDTLRADRVGAYGSTTAETPAIDRLAREGTLYEHAVAPLPETRPSHFTLFTSRYPRDHGVVSNAFALDQSAESLAEVYARAGYRTAAFVGCALFGEDSGAQQGFAHFDGPTLKQQQRTAADVVPLAQAWLTEVVDAGEASPFFLWVHLFDPHMPYAPPPPFNDTTERHRLVERFPFLSWPVIWKVANRRGELPGPVLQRGLDLYAGEVEVADHWLGRLFETLEGLDRWNDTVVVLVADHGECFENGVYFEHSTCLGEGALAVPLIVRAPGRVEAGKRVGATVELLDVAPTMLRLSGLRVPAAFRGQGLAKRAAGDERAAFFQHPFYNERSIRDREDVLRRLPSVAGDPLRPIAGGELQVGARRGHWKYLRRGEREELYDLDADPGERHDLAAGDPETTRGLRDEVRGWLREHPFELPEDADIDPGLRKVLQGLGYLD